MYSAKELAIARLIKPDIEVAQLDVTDLAILQLVRKATGGGSGIYNATIENGIATFGGVVVSQPLVSLLLNIPISQTGSGTSSPDNIRDFVGVSGVQLFRGGADILADVNFESGKSINNAGDVIEVNGYKLCDFVDVSNFSIIAIKAYKPSSTGRYFRVCGYDSTKTFTGAIKSEIRRKETITELIDVSNVDFIRITWGNDSTIEAYNGNTYQITFGQTVYSAILDVLTGKLILPEIIKTIDENSNIDMTSVTSIFYWDDFFDIANDTESVNCNCYFKDTNRANPNNVSGSNQDLTFCCRTSAPTLYIKDTRFTSIEDYKTWLSTNPVKIAVKLATPIEIQLTPTVINTLIGENVIFADVADVTECKYTRK